MDEKPKRETVGAPTELADAQEVPEWFANIVKAATAGPIVIAFVFGILPCGICTTIWCITTLFL